MNNDDNRSSPSLNRSKKPCRFFLKGHCKYGDACPDVHDGSLTLPKSSEVSVPSTTTVRRGMPSADKGGPQNFSGRGKNKPVGMSARQNSHLPRSPEISKAPVDRHAAPSASGATPPVTEKTRAGPRKEKPCYQWKAGNCAYGQKCQFSHDPQVKFRKNPQLSAEEPKIVDEDTEALKAAREAEQQELERSRQEVQAARAAEQQALERSRQELQATRKAEIDKQEAAMTITEVVLNSTIVTFAAGATIRNVITGFESCRVRVAPLPLNSTRMDVEGIFKDQGVESFHVVGMTRMSAGKHLEATVILEDKDAKKMRTFGLEGFEFRGERLRFEVSENGVVNGMDSSSKKDPNMLTISCFAPSVSVVVIYPTLAEVDAKVRALDRKVCSGRRVRAFRDRTNLSSLLVHNLAPTAMPTDIEQFSGSSIFRFLKPKTYDVDRAMMLLRYDVEAHASGGLKEFVRDTSTAGELDGMVTVRVHFDSWDQAKSVYDFLLDRRMPYIDNLSFRLILPDPLRYSISIPRQQYQAQTAIWNAFPKSSTDDQSAFIKLNPKDTIVFVSVTGGDKKAVGALKVRVEKLVAGEKLEFWHPFFGSATGDEFLKSVLGASGAFVRPDWRSQALKVYGTPAAIQMARNMVKDKVDDLASLEYSVILKRRSVGFFVRRGLAELKEILGADNVKLNIASGKISVIGGEPARHALMRLVDDSMSATANSIVASTGSNVDPCPICFDDAIQHPVQLACGHSYCPDCLRHFLASAASDSKVFPLSCIGDDAKCTVAISIPTLQRFLLPLQFTQLLETSFQNFIERQSQSGDDDADYKYCTTADCSQIYRSSKASSSGEGVFLQCPSCFLSICTACHQESHEGMTCRERSHHQTTAEQELEELTGTWARENGAKQCPSCRIFIQKAEGCNHMTCRCGAHICWRCMGIFESNTIYQHMRDVHGGIHGDADQVADRQGDMRILGIEELRARGLLYDQPPQRVTFNPPLRLVHPIAPIHPPRALNDQVVHPLVPRPVRPIAPINHPRAFNDQVVHPPVPPPRNTGCTIQ